MCLPLLIGAAIVGTGVASVNNAKKQRRAMETAAKKEEARAASEKRDSDLGLRDNRKRAMADRRRVRGVPVPDASGFTGARSFFR